MLFNNTEKIKTYATFTAIDFGSIRNLIKNIEEKHLLPILGPQYEDLNERYMAIMNVEGALLDTANENLLEACRQVIAPYICYYYAPLSEISLSDAGARRAETATQKTAYKYQVQNYIQANLRMAEEATEKLLAFLEINKATYTLWHDSTQFEEYRSLFISTSMEFNRMFPTESPFSIYWACRAKMYDIEQNEIKPMLGSVLFADLKAKSLDDSLSASEKQLISILNQAIARLAIAYNMPFINVTMGRTGLTTITKAPASKDDVITTGPADPSAINNAQLSALSSAKQWLQNAKNHMKDNATEFTDWPGNHAPTKISSTTTSFGLI